MKKLFFSILMVLLLFSSCLTKGLNFDFIVNAYTEGYYSYDVQNNEAIITYVNTEIKGNVNIPATLGGYPVTCIGEYAFANLYNIKSILLPNSIKFIYDGAFSDCKNISSVWYCGSQDEKDSINILAYNESLINATWHYNTCENTHTYTNDCDSTCDLCDWTRPITHDHKPEFDSENHFDKCTVCGDTININTHKFEDACDTSCLCGYIRTITHAYKTIITKATNLKGGSVVTKCTVCGNTASKRIIKYVKSFKLSTSTYTYNGEIKTPTVTVNDSAKKELKKDTDYTVTYAKGAKKVGKYKVKIKLKGNYSGTKYLYYEINPAKTKLSKLEAGENSIKVYIKKQAPQVSGYQVQYSTSKTFKNAKTKTISSCKKTKYTLKSLKAKKTYYVRVRTYKTVKGKKYYSKWSSYKTKKPLKAAVIIKNVPIISQLPKYPTGCESVSAVMALKYSGNKISVKKFIRDYLPRDKEFYYKNGKLYGPSPYECFVGDPKSSYSYGCMAPVLQKAISKCVGKSARVKSLKKYTVNELCKKYIDKGDPVIMWATIDMKKVKRVNSWYLKNGKRFTWPGNEHCMVLVGYDDKNYYFNDPYKGKLVSYKKSLVEKRFDQLGRQALVIQSK